MSDVVEQQTTRLAVWGWSGGQASGPITKASRAPRRREMLVYIQPSGNYTCAHLIKSKEETWEPQEYPNQ